MSALLRAFEAFFYHLSAIAWGSLAVALALHVAKTAARTRAWRNIIAASYPAASVRWRSVFGSYAAGVGVNALLPARGGDVLKLYLVKRRVAGSTYPTLASTLLVETIFDLVAAVGFLVWALSLGVLPGLDALPRLPAIDWLWLFQSAERAAVAGAVALVTVTVGATWLSRRVATFWNGVAQGFAIVREPRRYAREVALWQAVDWSLRLVTLYFFLRAFGIEPTVYNAALVQVTQSLSTILPLTPAGIGTEQALVVYVLRGTASATELLSFSVGMKLALIAINVVIGFTAIAVMLRTFRWRSVVDQPAEAGGDA